MQDIIYFDSSVPGLPLIGELIPHTDLKCVNQEYVYVFYEDNLHRLVTYKISPKSSYKIPELAYVFRLEATLLMFKQTYIKDSLLRIE